MTTVQMQTLFNSDQLKSQQLESSVSYIRPNIAKDNNDIILQIPFCDTLFQIKKDSYSPKYILKLKNTGLKPEMMKSQELRRDVARFTTQFSTPYETKKFLLFRVDYKGDPKIIIQDKSTNTWELLDAPLNKKPGFRVRGVDEVSFTPMFCTDDYYYSFIDAIDFKEYFSEIYPDIVKSINDEDNPVIVRAKVK